MEVVLSDDVTRLMVDVVMFTGKRIKNINKHTLTSETRNHKKSLAKSLTPRLLVGSALSCGTLKSTLMKTRLPLTSTSLMLSLAGMVKAKQQNGFFGGNGSSQNFCALCEYQICLDNLFNLLDQTRESGF